MIDVNNILETINMIKLYNLDIRTVTLALSLRDCICDDTDKLCENIKNKIKKYAANLVSCADELADVEITLAQIKIIYDIHRYYSSSYTHMLNYVILQMNQLSLYEIV